MAQRAAEALRRAVLNADGLRPEPGWPARQTPPTVRRRSGQPPEVMAAALGYPDAASMMAALVATGDGAAGSAPPTRLDPGARFRVTTSATGGNVDAARVLTVCEVLGTYPYHADAKFLAPDGGPVTGATVGRLQLCPVIATTSARRPTASRSELLA